MKRIVIILCLLFAGFSSLKGQTYNEIRTHLIEEEGYSSKPYKIRGHWHIGIGHRIYGHVPAAMSTYNINRLFANDLKVACNAAYNNINTFSKHPKPIRIMLVGLAYNVGPEGFYQFVRFRQAIDRFDYQSAAHELSISLWAKQLPNRSERYINTLKSY